MFENTIKDIAYSQEIADLEKDNEELKAQIEQLKKQYKKQRNRRIDELQKENADLEKDKEYLDKVNNEQTEVILKLNEQIEKMKCCQNCSIKDCFEKYQYNKKCKYPNKWELAEWQQKN